MNLFQLGRFTLASGEQSDFKIDCDALTDEDWICLAHLLSQKIEWPFSKVFHVPTGGLKLAKYMEAYITPEADDHVLLVDDVWTTGGSWKKVAEPLYEQYDYVIGGVIFARTHKDFHILPIASVFSL